MCLLACLFIYNLPTLAKIQGSLIESYATIEEDVWTAPKCNLLEPNAVDISDGQMLLSKDKIIELFWYKSVAVFCFLVKNAPFSFSSFFTADL